MAFFRFPSLQSESGIRQLVLVAALLVLPATLALLLSGKSPALTDARALEAAQLARHLAAGDGFTTSVLRPLAVAGNAGRPAAPDLVQAPVQPLLLALAFRANGPTAATVTGFGFCVWLLTGWLVFLVARAWWDNWVALVAITFYLTGTGLLAAAGSGLPHPVLALCLLGIWWFGFPPPANDQPVTLPAWRLALTGVLCAIAILTDYLLAPVGLLLVIHVALTQRPRGRAVLATLIGLLVVLVPWWTRNVLAGGGLWGLFGYEALTNTVTFPGQTIWLQTANPPHPLVHFVAHPFEFARKVGSGLLQLRAAGSIVDPVVAFLFATALWGAAPGSWRKRLAFSVAVAAILVLGLGCVVRPEPQLLLAWSPLLACVAAAQLVVWTKSRRESAPLTSLLTHGLALSLVALPLLPFLMRPLATTGVRQQEVFATLAPRLPATGVVVTDTPASVAWYLERPALWLPLAEEDWELLARQNDGIAAAYLSAPWGTPGPAWWAWLRNTRGVYRDLTTVPSLLPGVVRLASPSTTTKSDLVFEQLRAGVRLSPAATEAYLQLGQACLQRGRLREAQTAFATAHTLEPDGPAAQIGMWESRAQLDYADGTLRLARLAAQFPTTDPRAATALEQAAQHFTELSRQAPREPWIQLNLALCALRRGRDADTAAHLAALNQLAPRTLPARLLLAEYSAQSGQTESALKECRQLLQAEPTHAGGWLLLGRLLLATDQAEEALAAYSRAANLRPESGTAQVFAGEACRRLKRYDQALEFATAAAKIPATARLAQLGLAAIHADAGRPTEALTGYRRFLEVEPDHPIALNNLAELLAKQNEMPEALRLAARLSTLYPSSPAILDTVGWIHFRAGQLEPATQHLREALRLAPRLGSAHFHLGQVLQAQGKKEEAASAFRRALQLGLTDADKQAAKQALAANPK